MPKRKDFYDYQQIPPDFSFDEEPEQEEYEHNMRKWIGRLVILTFMLACVAFCIEIGATLAGCVQAITDLIGGA
jgi:hypothetical protein